MLKYKGFTLIEIMVTAAFMTIISLGLYSLRISQLNAFMYTSGKAGSSLLANIIINKIQANYTISQTSLSVNTNYIETNYTDDTTMPSVDCSVNTCTSTQLAKYDLYNWKTGFSAVTSSVVGVVCLDSKATNGNYGVPTLTSPNCSGNGDAVVKIVWNLDTPSAESLALSSTSYLIVKVPNR